MIPFSGNRHLKKKIKPNSNVSYIFLCEIFLNIFGNQRKEESLATRFFREAYLWSSIWSSTVEVPFIFIDLFRFSIIDVPSSRTENVLKPRLPPYASPLSAVSSTCKEIMWDKCYGSVRLALFIGSRTKKCVV